MEMVQTGKLVFSPANITAKASCFCSANVKPEVATSAIVIIPVPFLSLYFCVLTGGFKDIFYVYVCEAS